ncbi:MAG: 2-amino-4-hydroxy-6-hydroxymethyldihydropteridine diphosphokinase [Natronospirillum sp.]|uniref:2-amino-4-hydroxy-6- hydroxymethyldihydropteridine diphosphokinase n=1 Tax=Natronospirillum sp. TaxID=2812955 RepID=UPI0025D48C56|nr:2-amino-4-hydroxy-6-hydroxymethyldihydropteridine diphosphokinase [Natronospirillum sp.]MCH8552490.1 2-amino-4-hydroxy-6-hydroxymethyldihydropteridine diphosphokinase [Natronospirillum sp.]
MARPASDTGLRPIDPVEVLLGLGSNTDRERHLQLGLQSLQSTFGSVECSQVYESAAVGFDGQPFYNAVAAIQTDWDIDQLNQWLKKLEDQYGRDRTQPKFSNRNLDIDILTFGRLSGQVAGILLPRAECFRHAFVLRPLAELRPQMTIPGEDRTWADLWLQIGHDLQPLRTADLCLKRL